ncbi:bile acid:sodium symporter family protein [Micropruina sonneratiae]|uniref:bile acid:sodium symporter family protein n=1 Tax=Micropruina sonneratiae TaxID=2986940 RepID=UPI0022269C6C|nr:bile acid:sodium symporter family protein [Micropruina sp. KQZ13P-5]MCW3157225.1 bile acid:sodium symporter [Micropruina sp. KQZ13P-5]
MGWLKRIDRFLLAIVTAAVVASLLPAQGVMVDVVAWATKVAVAVLFFVYGVRLKPEQALAGLKHWRLHLTILALTYLLFPLIGWSLQVLSPWLLSPSLYAGVLYLTLLPSTVQSSINFTSIAKGNVAGAIVSASASNMLGVFLTPLLCWALLTTSGGIAIDPSSTLDIIGQLLVPFILGQLSRRWTADWVAAHPRLKLFDQGVVVLVVYSAFSAGMREHMWQQVSITDLLVLLGVCLVVLAGMLWFSHWLAVRLGFDRADVIAIQFCGTKKSLATGLPMANVLFAGSPIGLLVLPLMIFHQAQLMACGSLASRYAKQVPDAG